MDEVFEGECVKERSKRIILFILIEESRMTDNTNNGWIKVTYKPRRARNTGRGYTAEPPNYWKPEQPFHNSWQDWSPVRIDKTVLTAVETGKPRSSTAGKRQVSKPEAQHLAKIALADGPMRPKKLTHESLQTIVSLRMAQNWDQVELNVQCQFPVNTIREIEAGRLVPTIQQLNTLNRVLKTGLKLE